MRRKMSSEGFFTTIISIDLFLCFIAFFIGGAHRAKYQIMHVIFIIILVLTKALFIRGIIKIYKEIYTDILTGLYTRKYFYRKMRSITRILPLSLLFIDIDNFKAINDTYGHIVGDWVLLQFANLLRKHKRKKDFIFRWGGEEFVVVLFHTSNREAYDIADLIMKDVEEHVFYHDGIAVKTTISIGIASAEEKKAVDIEKMLEAADKALYQAKANKNYVMAGK